MKNATDTTKSENKIQQSIVQWYKNKFCLTHHNPRSLIAAIPNGANVPNNNRMTLLATGLYPGFSDLIVFHASANLQVLVMLVEVKTESGTQSDAQISFQSQVQNLGFQYHIVRSLTEFQTIILAL